MSRWSPDNNAFRIHKNLVYLSFLDVCFGLGLRVVGEEVKLEDDRGGLVNELFEDGEKKIQTILQKLGDKNLRRKKNVDDFCRLYIFLALCFICS